MLRLSRSSPVQVLLTDCVGTLTFVSLPYLFLFLYLILQSPLSLSRTGDLVGDGVQLNSTAFNSARVAITKTAKRSSRRKQK